MELTHKSRRMEREPITTISRDPIIEYLEWLMDRAIPVGRWSFGLDGILGLIPGLGDVVSGIVSSYIIARAARAGVPRAALARMMTNSVSYTHLRAHETPEHL